MAIGRAKREAWCECLSAEAVLHDDAQNEDAPGWRKLLGHIADLQRGGAEEMNPSMLTWEEMLDVVTLPPSIGELKSVTKVLFYGSHLRWIPPEIGAMESLQRLNAYTSYALHWLPYELTRCRQLSTSLMSTRGLFGNRKTRLPFPRLDAPIAALLPNTCSVCDGLFESPPDLLWHTLYLGTDFVPLLIHSCSAECTAAVPDAPAGYSKRPHKGGPLSITLRTVAEFAEFVPHAPRNMPGVAVAPDVWEGVAQDVDATEIGVRLRELPPSMLRAGAVHPSAETRRSIARRRDMPAEIDEILATDAEEAVRLTIARKRSAPRHVLTLLVDDPSEPVRVAAAKQLAAANAD